MMKVAPPLRYSSGENSEQIRPISDAKKKMLRLIGFLAFAAVAHALKVPVPSQAALQGRRSVLAGAGALFAPLFASQLASAYDTIPQAAPDFEMAEKKRKERDAKVKQATGTLLPYVSKIEATTTASEFEEVRPFRLCRAKCGTRERLAPVHSVPSIGVKPVSIEPNVCLLCFCPNLGCGCLCALYHRPGRHRGGRQGEGAGGPDSRRLREPAAEELQVPKGTGEARRPGAAFKSL